MHRLRRPLGGGAKRRGGKKAHGFSVCCWRYAVLGSDTPFSVSAIIQPDPLPGDEKDGNAVYIVLLAAIPAAVLLALLLVFLYRKKRKAQDNPPAGGKDPSEPDGGNTKN